MELEIGIEILDPELESDLFESTESREKIITEGVSIRFKNYKIREIVDYPTIINIAVYIAEHIALPVAAGVLSRYLYDKLKDRENQKITINNIPVEVNAEKIENLIIQILRKEREE